MGRHQHRQLAFSPRAICLPTAKKLSGGQLVRPTSLLCAISQELLVGHRRGHHPAERLAGWGQGQDGSCAG